MKCFVVILFLKMVLGSPVSKENLRNHHYNQLDMNEEAGLPLSAEDFERGLVIDKDNDGVYSTQYFEKDIVVPMADRNGVLSESKMWPKSRVPYTLSANYTDRDRAIIANAIQEYHNKTCIRFVPKEVDDKDYVKIYPANGCWSSCGKVGGEQGLSLGKGCMVKGVVQHELMHAIGFAHEHSRADRDDYVTINLENIEPGFVFAFDKYTWNDFQNLSLPYDYLSVMHYPSWAFSKNKKPTLEAKDPKMTPVIGQSKGLSDLDVEKINRLYNCTEYLKKPETKPGNTTEPLTVKALLFGFNFGVVFGNDSVNKTVKIV